MPNKLEQNRSLKQDTQNYLSSVEHAKNQPLKLNESPELRSITSKIMDGTEVQFGKTEICYIYIYIY